MSRPPIDLDNRDAVLSALADIPLRVRPQHTDLIVMIAGPDRRSGMLLLVDDVPDAHGQHERVKALARMWRQLRADRPDAVVTVAVCRGGHLDPTGDDLAWHDAIRATSAHAGIICLGVYLATHHGVTELLPRAA